MKYLKLFLTLFNHSSKRYLESRLSTLGNMFISLLNFFIQLYLIEILFMNTVSLAGWTKPEVFLIVGISKLFGTIFSLLFQRSINHLVTEIAEGNLDLILTKPFSSQFYYSFFLIRSFEILNLLIPITLIWYSLSTLNSVYSTLNLVLMFIMVFCGVVIFYSIYLMFASITFWVGRFSAFPSLYNIFSIPLSVPLDIYGKNAALFLTFIFPLAFVVTVPAQVLLGKLEIAYVGLGIFFASFLLLVSIKVWNKALLNYSSASS